MDNLKVLVAGGGIGGLTAALCLARRGFEVAVFEQAREFGESGAGIQLSPNCASVLHHLGLEPALRESAFLPVATQFRHWRSGKVISESPLGDVVRRFGAPYYHIHRGDLLTLLLHAARREPGITLKTSAKVERFSQTENGVRLKVVSQQVEHGDVLVGADGIRSVVREQLWGPEQPRFTGNVAWRALVPADRLPAGLIRPMATAWWGPHKHFVHYYVRRGELVNCVCVVEKAGWEVESWTEPGDIGELKSDFAGWHDNIQRLIDQVAPESLYKWALFDRAPASQWGNERVTLLGDACHPTLPFMAQGAAMAIEDAAVLAGSLANGDAVADSLQRYEGLRRQRTADIQAGSRRNAAVFHLSGIPAWLRNRAVARAGGRTMDKLFSYDALAVADSRASSE